MAREDLIRVTFRYNGKRYERTGKTQEEAQFKAALYKEQLLLGENSGLKQVVYPALFYKYSDGGYGITYPDLPGCKCMGKSLGDAMRIAQAALMIWIERLIENKLEIPGASDIRDVKTKGGEFSNYICAEIKTSAP